MTEDGKIRLGFIGAGGNARHHMSQVLKVEDFSVAALSDPNPAALQKAVERCPELAGVPAYADWREMLRNTQLDAVEISTPHTTHYEQVVAALDAGLNVLCEKPLVCTVAHAQDLVKRLEQSRKVGLLSYQRHYQPEFRYMREKIASGEFGAVQFVNALQCQQWKKGTAGSWRQDPALSGGGQLNDSGSHLLDIILWVTGLGVRAVSAFIDNCGTPVDINSAISTRFVNGALGNISIVGDAPTWHEDLTIWCERGVFFMRNGKLEVCNAEGKRTVPEDLPAGSFPDQNFADAIKGRAVVESPFTCGLRVIELTEAAWRSGADNGAVVTVG